MQNTNNPATDEIDFFGLFSNLWKNKLTIIAITCLGIIFAAIYAFTAKEEWTSKTQIIHPNAVQLGSFLEVQRGYLRFSREVNVNSDDSSLTVQMGASRFVDDDSVKVKESIKNVYDTLIVKLNATDNKIEYLQDSDYFRRLATEMEDSAAKQRLLVTMATNNLRVKETEKNKRDSFDVSFTAETPNDAQKTLQGYIETTNKLVLNKLFGDLRLQINERIRTMEHDANNLKQQTEQSRKNQIMVLKQAITTAKDANIIEYTGESTVAGNTIIDFSNSGSMFLLGEKYLTAQLQSLENSPIIYPVPYYQTLNNISGLQQLLGIEPKGMAFEYTLAPSYPLVKDKPKKGLILIFGALVGALVGVLLACGIALVRASIKNRKKAY